MDRRAFVLAGAAAALPLPAPFDSAQGGLGQTRAAMTAATIAGDSTLSVYYAKEEGFFDRAGLNVTINLMNNGADILAAVTSGAIDVGLSNTMSLVLAFKKGAPLQLVAPSGLFSKSSAAIAIVVLKTAAIANAKDLEGKVVGASPIKGFPQLATDAWIEKNGGDPAKVRYVEMPFSEMQPALVSGRIAAALMGEPFTSEAKGTCRVLAIPYFALAPQLMTSAYCTSTAFATAHPDRIARFASAMRAAAVWANKNQVKTGAMLAALTKLDPLVIADMQRSLYAETLAPALIQPAIDLAYARKVIDAPFPASDMIFHPGK